VVTYGTISVSDHPVCAASEASRLLVTGAATPPHEEGTAPTETTPIHSGLFMTARSQRLQ